MSDDSYVVYLPALKAKAGEFGALEKLSLETKRRIRPLLDVLPVPIDWNTNAPSKSLEEHLNAICRKIVKCWGTEQALFVDFFDLPLEERTSAGLHPVRHLFGAFDSARVKAIPVTGLDRDDAYNDAVKHAALATKGAVAFRLLVEDIVLPTKTSSPLSKLIARLGTVPDKSWLILDFRGLTEEGVSEATQQALVSLRTFTRLFDWKRIALLASGMPDGLGDIRPNTRAAVPRTELSLWRGVVAGKPPATPVFGDYGVLNPEFTEPMDPRKIKPSAKIRYTRERDWLIAKGTSFRKDPGQFRRMAAFVAGQPGYAGKAFSWGDEYIAVCPKKPGGAGNLETWVRVDTNHHIEFVSKQISTLLAS